MDRLTTDNPETNLQALLNYAYAKDKAVHLALGNGEDNIPLDEYIAHEACQRGCQTTTTEVMEGGCMECDCPIAILNAVAIQAAELRGRLKLIEDILGDTYDLDHLRDLLKKYEDAKEAMLTANSARKCNTIVGIIMASYLDSSDKTELIDFVRQAEAAFVKKEEE